MGNAGPRKVFRERIFGSAVQIRWYWRKSAGDWRVIVIAKAPTGWYPGKAVISPATTRFEFLTPMGNLLAAGFAGVDHLGGVRRVGFNMISASAEPFAAKTLHQSY